jgi:DNA-binding beta-propeller fold protein YncE
MVLLAVSTLWLWSALRGTSGPGSSEGVSPLDPRVTATIEVGRSPQGLAVGEGSTWVAVPTDGCAGEIVRIDPATNEIATRVPVDGWPSDLAVGFGSVWVEGEVCDPAGPRSAVARIDPASTRVVESISVGETTADVAVGEAAVWVTVADYGARTSGEVVRIDPATNAVVARVPLRGDPRDVVVGDGAVWVVSLLPEEEAHLCAETEACMASPGTLSGLEVLRIDPSTNEVVDRFPNVLALAGGEGILWMSVWLDEETSGLVRVDPATGRRIGDPIPGDFRGFAGEHGTLGTMVPGTGGLWYWGLTSPTSADGVIYHLDASTLRVDASVDPDTTWIDAALAPDGSTLWVSNYENTVTRIDLR